MIHFHCSSFYTNISLWNQCCSLSMSHCSIIQPKKTIKKMLILLPSGNKLILFYQTVEASLCSRWSGYLLFKSIQTLYSGKFTNDNTVSRWKNIIFGSKHCNIDVAVQSQYCYLSMYTCLYKYCICVSRKYQSCKTCFYSNKKKEL